jgi:hypothetical protein
MNRQDAKIARKTGEKLRNHGIHRRHGKRRAAEEQLVGLFPFAPFRVFRVFRG